LLYSNIFARFYAMNGNNNFLDISWTMIWITKINFLETMIHFIFQSWLKIELWESQVSRSNNMNTLCLLSTISVMYPLLKHPHLLNIISTSIRMNIPIPKILLKWHYFIREKKVLIVYSTLMRVLENVHHL
jgi:hypothetical protein